MVTCPCASTWSPRHTAWASTIEDVLEPYLIQQGYMVRTPRGRMVTRNAYLHFGLPQPSQAGAASLPLDLEGEGDN